VFIGALCLLPAARLSLGWCGYQRTHRWLEKAFPASTAPFAPVRRARFVADCDIPAETRFDGMVVTALAEQTLKMVRSAAANSLFQTTCLQRSMVLLTLLRRQGLRPELRFGARVEAGALAAHAWVEMGSVSLDPSGCGRSEAFAPFALRATLG
jgi:hypothetical protein